MPDGLNPCRQSEGRLRQFVANGRTIGKEKKVLKCNADRSSDIPQIGVPTSATATTTESPTPPPGKKPRAKQSSAFFGVRYRPDLQKYVAEIRVYEWKSVDKKVWLGTFDSEFAAACAVDAARKLLKCQKKREPNVPCPALSAYKESIPPHLQLTNITDDSMFKEVTLFVKRKVQEYAAELCTSRGPAGSAGGPATVAVGLVAPQQYEISVGHGSGSCFHLPPDVETPSRSLFVVPEDDVFPSPQTGSSCSFGPTESFRSYVTELDGAVMLHPWDCSPTSGTYSSGPSSCTSSEGTSPEDTSWVQVQQPSAWNDESLLGWSREAGLGGEYCMVAPSPSWPEEQMSVPVVVPMPMGMEDQTTVDFEVEDMPYLFNMDDMDDMEEEQECGGGDRAVDSTMNIFFEKEDQARAQVIYTDNEYGNWTFQEGFSSLSYNPFTNSFGKRNVC